MIRILYPGPAAFQGSVVESAFRRSCGRRAVSTIPVFALGEIPADAPAIIVFVDPPDEWSPIICRLIESAQKKVILFGAIPNGLADFLSIQESSSESIADEFDHGEVVPAKVGEPEESSLRIRYNSSFFNLLGELVDRPLVRYDFEAEWNNLGFGMIHSRLGAIWGVAQPGVLAGRNSLGDIIDTAFGRSTVKGTYVALWEQSGASFLWWNRSVGPVDSGEWKIVEDFICNARCEELPCQPVIRDVPGGYQSAVTSRLDCDEDVESSRYLFNSYQEWEIPFSLAVCTRLLDDAKHHQILKDVSSRGGAVLSHSQTHFPEWGGNYRVAVGEAKSSKKRIESILGESVEFVVSPFHQTPRYAVEALQDTGYQGVVSGIPRNDPELFVSRAGTPPFASEGFITHSQATMLHGDCLVDGRKEDGNPNPGETFQRAFQIALKSESFFGYLDHPFSERYAYGWDSEEQRAAVHRELIKVMKESSEKVWFANQNEALAFLASKDRLSYKENRECFKFGHGERPGRLPIEVIYRKQRHRLPVNSTSLLISL
ncbi:MAG: hypothetical protein P1U86_06335 [Verrucomicrobiales bacterium]|nr:hypothetical protein [Verrucomicrobiales bacterium]